MLNNKPLIHLWTYNHVNNGILDQIDFFVSVLRQHNYIVSVGKKPHLSALNVVIENFSAASRNTLRRFHQTYRKQVAVIMTEHIDFDLIHHEIKVHGNPLYTENDYMKPIVQIERLRFLMDCLPYIHGFLILGDLPELRHFSKIFPGIPLSIIPFPKLDSILTTPSSPVTHDLLFTGFMTQYRQQVLKQLKTHELELIAPKRYVSQQDRQALMISSKIILNIPQRHDWGWMSPMRIIASYNAGKGVISLNTHDHSSMASCCPQLDLNSTEWLPKLKEYINNWRSVYEESVNGYRQMTFDFEKKYPFPKLFFDAWALIEENKMVKNLTD